VDEDGVDAGREGWGTEDKEKREEVFHAQVFWQI
jgi:hypothetical protein